MNSGCGARFCPRCQASLDAQPLGALTRRWSAEYADATGMMSGLLCDSCKSLVRKNNARVSNGESMFHFVDPNRPGGGARARARARVPAPLATTRSTQSPSQCTQ